MSQPINVQCKLPEEINNLGCTVRECVPQNEGCDEDRDKLGYGGYALHSEELAEFAMQLISLLAMLFRLD
jgi:hypothetical protein